MERMNDLQYCALVVPTSSRYSTIVLFFSYVHECAENYFRENVKCQTTRDELGQVAQMSMSWRDLRNAVFGHLELNLDLAYGPRGENSLNIIEETVKTVVGSMHRIPEENAGAP